MAVFMLLLAAGPCGAPAANFHSAAAARELRSARFAEHYEGVPRTSLLQSLSPAREMIGDPPSTTTGRQLQENHQWRGAGTQPVWPQMVHMALTGRPGEVVIEWVSGAPEGTSVVEVSDEPGCVDSKPNCACFPYWCWRRNQSACLADPICRNNTKGGGAEGGPLLQNVTRYPATEWFHSAMPRDPKTGAPLCETAADPQSACLQADGKFMDTVSYAAALNYSLHQAVVTGLIPGKTYYYRVGSTLGRPHDGRDGQAGGWSDIVAFNAFPPAHREPIWAIYGCVYN